VSEIDRLRQKASLLFVNKKKQKNFVNWSTPAAAEALQSIKSFLLLFFKEDASCLSLQLIDFTYYHSGQGTGP
jgi:hypothetical protein